jgi:outer membrane protein OmpA-like peptidoglycan-associated protein
MQWEDAIVRAIHSGERRVKQLLKIGRDAGGPDDAAVRPAVLRLLKIPFPRATQAGGVVCEQHVRKLADRKPDTPRIIFTGRYESQRTSGLRTFWAINQAGTAVLAVRTLRSAGPHGQEYWVLRGDLQEDGTAVLFQVDKPDQMWGFLQQQPNRSIKWHHGSYLGADGKRVVVDDKPERDEVMQLSADNRPTMMESLFKSDDFYLSVLLQQREWFPLTRTTYEFLRDSAGSDLLRDLLTDYVKLPKGITYQEQQAKQTAAQLVVNYISHMLWNGEPATSPDILALRPRSKAFGERARQYIPHGHFNNPHLARHVAKLWLAHAKLNHAGEKRSFLDWLTKQVEEQQDVRLAELLDLPLRASRSAGTHRYHLRLDVVSFGYFLGYAEGHLTVEKLTEPKWPSPVVFDVVAGTLGKPKLPSRDEVFDLSVTVGQEWGVDDFEGSLWLGEVTASAGVKGVTGGATVLGGYLRSKNGLLMALEDAEPFIKPGGGGKQGKPKFKVRAEGMVGRVRRSNDKIIDLSKPYVANRNVVGDLFSAGHFCFDSALLTPAARQLLRVVCSDQLAALASPTSQVFIVGHTDRVGTLARNQELSDLRAKNVRTALKDILGPALKVPDSAIRTLGVGEWGAILNLLPNEVRNPEDRRVDLWVNARLVATFRE